MLVKTCLIVALLLLPTVSAAQSDRPTPSPSDNQSGGRLPREEKRENDFPDEMLKKMEIARKESEHKKVLEDADKLSDLSEEVFKNFGERRHLASDDLKKLGTIEKLAKHVLTNAGGEEVDDKPDDAANLTIANALEKLSAAAASIRKEMKAETRFVTSASVIAKSNEVISLSRFIRHNQKAD